MVAMETASLLAQGVGATPSQLPSYSGQNSTPRDTRPGMHLHTPGGASPTLVPEQASQLSSTASPSRFLWLSSMLRS